MKTRYFATNERRMFVRTANVEDLLGDHDYAELGSPRARENRQMAKDLFCGMMQMVAEDMVERADVFVLPRKDFGVMRIGDISNDAGGFRYIGMVNHNFRYFGGKLFLDKIIRRVNGGKLYRFKMVRPLHQRLLDRINEGVTYAE